MKIDQEHDVQELIIDQIQIMEERKYKIRKKSKPLAFVYILFNQSIQILMKNQTNTNSGEKEIQKQEISSES